MTEKKEDIPLPFPPDEVGRLMRHASDSISRVCAGVCESEIRAVTIPEGEFWVTVQWKPKGE